jgi:tetratricopeptide (TPR) repeat protein
VADGGPSDYALSDYWDRLVQRGPAEALVRIDEVLQEPDLSRDARALAHAASARSLFDLGRVRDALASARCALDASEGTASDTRAVVAMASSVVVAEAGFVDEALVSLEELAASSTGVGLGRVRLQIAYVLHHAGRLNEALSELDVSERLFRDGGEDRDRFRVHHHRGLVLLQQGRLSGAESDFVTAESYAVRLGMAAAQAQTVANLAVLHGRARRLTESLSEFDRAFELFELVGNPARMVAHAKIDRAEVLIHAGLVLDAIDAGRAALELIEPSGNRIVLGDAHLMVARAELAAGHLRAATQSASRSIEIFAASGRPDMVPQAQSIALTAAVLTECEPSRVKPILDEIATVVGRLRSHGWEANADELALVRVRTGLRFGLTDEIRPDIRELRRGVADGRRQTVLAGWYAEAIGRSLAGDVAGALEACRTGLDLLDDIVAEAASLEQRSAAMRLGHDLSQFTIELAVDLGDADTVLAAAEGTRGRALHDELVERERHQPLTEAGAQRLRGELAARLGNRVLIEWIVVHDDVWAVVFDADGSRLVRVAARSEVAKARDRVVMWLDLAAAEPDESSERALRAGRVLDDLLISPLDLPADVGVVMVPVDLLHGIPWCGLPSFSTRPVSMTPNAQVWMEADRRAAGAVRSVSVVVGPALAGGDTELAAIQRWYPGSAVASGPGATARTVRSMLAGSDLVQIAAHGRFRSDHPLLSTLELHGGEATLYEAIPERVRSKLVVLSSCEGGAQGTADGSEVIGMSAVLLARGASTVIAPLTVVRELECAEFIADVHGELAAGVHVACALANVRGRWLADDDLSRWAVASSFGCFGSGAVVVVG